MAAQISRFPMAETPEERAIRAETEANVISYAEAIARRRQRAPEPLCPWEFEMRPVHWLLALVGIGAWVLMGWGAWHLWGLL